MMDQRTSSRSYRSKPIVKKGPLRSLQLIESVGDVAPFRIVPILQAFGSAVSHGDLMAAKVRWAERAHYDIVTRDIPPEFKPYNSVIRISERGTEDRQRDYLAELVADEQDDQA